MLAKEAALGDSDSIAEDQIAVRSRRLARMYRELREAGHPVETLRGITRQHAQALLAFWRSKKRSISTIRSDWSVLRGWFEVLGKRRTIPSLRSLWPDAPAAPSTRQKAPAARQTDPLLLRQLQASADPTHYLVERLRQDLRLSAREALLFTPSATDLAPSVARKLDQARAADPQAVHSLLAELQQFLQAQRRTHLLWRGASIATGMRRHENRLFYLRCRQPGARSGG